MRFLKDWHTIYAISYKAQIHSANNQLKRVGTILFVLCSYGFSYFGTEHLNLFLQYRFFESFVICRIFMDRYADKFSNHGLESEETMVICLLRFSKICFHKGLYFLRNGFILTCT